LNEYIAGRYGQADEVRAMEKRSQWTIRVSECAPNYFTALGLSAVSIKALCNALIKVGYNESTPVEVYRGRLAVRQIESLAEGGK
jgi:hypothetical protein